MERTEALAHRVSGAEFSYFDLQAYVGTTKHMGGLETTKELVELCHVGQDTYVLDVGCGVGATACYLAQQHGCRVVGVDLRQVMVDRSNERAKREGVEDRVEFRAADAQNLPFDEALFDVVLCESVATFIRDRQRVASECARVTRPGGYVGFNEEVWVKTPPPAELVAFVRRTWEIEADVPAPDDWRGFLEAAGLQDLVVRAYPFDARRESSQVRRYRFSDMAGMLLRSLALGFRNPAFRKYMDERRHVPRNLFEYLGYGVFVGRK